MEGGDANREVRHIEFHDETESDDAGGRGGEGEDEATAVLFFGGFLKEGFFRRFLGLGLLHFGGSNGLEGSGLERGVGGTVFGGLGEEGGGRVGLGRSLSGRRWLGFWLGLCELSLGGLGVGGLSLSRLGLAEVGEALAVHLGGEGLAALQGFGLELSSGGLSSELLLFIIIRERCWSVNVFSV